MTVGDGGTILTSPDGIAWTPRSSGRTTGLASITNGADQFVVGEWGGAILTSPDAITWTKKDSGTRRGIYFSLFANSMFIGLDGDNFLTSYKDGAAILGGPVARGVSLRLTGSDLFASYPRFSGQSVHAVIFTTSGGKVMEVWGRGDEISLPVGDLARGVYTFAVASGRERVSSRFVKR